MTEIKILTIFCNKLDGPKTIGSTKKSKTLHTTGFGLNLVQITNKSWWWFFNYNWLWSEDFEKKINEIQKNFYRQLLYFLMLKKGIGRAQRIRKYTKQSVESSTNFINKRKAKKARIRAPLFWFFSGKIIVKYMKTIINWENSKVLFVHGTPQIEFSKFFSLVPHRKQCQQWYWIEYLKWN